MSEKIKFAVAGFGHIGKRHAEMISRHPNAHLIAVADTNQNLAEAADTLFHVPFFNSVSDLLKSHHKIDVVNICSPNGFHAQHAIEALSHNCHVVIEKPLGLSKAECEEVLQAALKVHRQVFCVMQNRYSPPSVWLKEIITENRLGKIYMVQVNCFWNRDDRYYKPNGKPHPWKGILKTDGGPLFTQFSHFVDIMYWLFGDITDVQARFENFNHQSSTDMKDDSGMVNFHFKAGGLGSFNYSTSVWDKNLESSITIIGEHGSVKVGGQYMDQVEYCHIKDYTMPQLAPVNPPNDYGAYKGSAANHQYIIENVIDTLQGKSTITTNAMEGMKVVDIIERIYQQLQ